MNSRNGIGNGEKMDADDTNGKTDDNIANELVKIMEELDQAGTSANGNCDKKTLDEMIVAGNVKGLPKGTNPTIGLEHQGMKLPIRENGRNLMSKLQSVLQAGKKKNANNFQKLPDAAPKTFRPPAPKTLRQPAPNVRPSTSQNYRPPPMMPPMTPPVLDALNLDRYAYHNFLQKNKVGGLDEYISTIIGNFECKYDLTIQRDIAENQKKCVIKKDDGGFAPMSYDGPGVDTEILVLVTKMTLHTRFSEL